MEPISLLDVRSFANEQLQNAKEFAGKIQFIQKSITNEGWTKEAGTIRASLWDDKELGDLQVGDGISAWASILSVDLRESTKLAHLVSPKEMYLAVHTLLPTLAFVCRKTGGKVMNFRGDGLLAAFGVKKILGEDDQPETSQKEQANLSAVLAGYRLLESVANAVQTVLADDGISIDLHCGVGIDCGVVTLTHVGWKSAKELTAYGACVNDACHLSTGKDIVVVSENVVSRYPYSGDEGKLSFVPRENGFLASCEIEALK